jgi:hypothetical protein
MQIEDFLRVYQEKSDEELIQLAVVPEQLTSEARLALHGELSRRSISTPTTLRSPNPMGTDTMFAVLPLAKSCKRAMCKIGV